MKQTLTFFLTLFLSGWGLATAQNHTYYYEKVAVVVNGQKTAASGDGHYLTMNSKVLYESNPNGTSKGFGIMNFEGDRNGLHTYGGDAYLGKGLTYYFASDYSRLNVHLYDGTILVYERKSQANQSRMRGYSQPSSGGGSYVPTTTYDPGYNSNSSSPQKGKDYYTTCSYCHGKGFVVEEQSISVSSYGLNSSHNYITCSCGKRYDSRSTTHNHRTCPKCQGSGQTKVR